MHKDSIDALGSLSKRMDTAVATLQNHAALRHKDLTTTQAVARQREIREDVARLQGKVEGLQLALSYLHDEMRLMSDGS